MNKKILSVLVFAALLLSLVACNKDEENEVSTVAKITVKEDGVAKAGVKVYMFGEQSQTVGISDPSFAKKTVVTESDGVATFKLQEDDLSLTDNQTTLLFAVFNKEETGYYKVLLTIEKGQTKSGVINL